MSKANDKKVVLKSKSNKSTKQRSKKATTKCEKCNKPFSYDPAGEKSTLCKACKNKIVYRSTCKDCGKEFYVKTGEAEFLKSKGLEMPKRCFECRNVRKIEKAKENG